jgi:signal transduction histidine kinase/CheY-like chemotaxis protein
MNVTDKAPAEVSFILPEYCTLVRTEQIAALFKNVGLNALGSLATSVLLATALNYLSVTDATTSVAWVTSTAMCVGAHVILRRAYHRRPTSDANWQRWALGFTAVSLVEGITWGWASVYLAPEGFFEIQVLVLAVTFGVVAAAIPARGSYFPAFCVLFFPATIPYVLLKIGDTSQVQQISGLFMLFYIAGMGGLAFNVNHNFKAAACLRIRSTALAEQFRQQKELADEANRAKSRFVAAASHDLRQPAHALSLLIGALRGIELPAEATLLVALIENSAVALDRLFAALLEISRLDAGIVEVHRQNLPIYPLLSRICSDYRELAAAKNITLKLKPCGASVFTDPVLFGDRIMRNLIANAVHYTDRGRVVVGCRIRGPYLSVEVWDTGPGIPTDQQQRIFEEFYQLKNVERDRAKGLGLGLAIVRRLTDLLGHQLSVVSQPDRGSCFRIDIPLASAMAPEELEAPILESGGALARALVVVIDDELPIREAMSWLLKSWGHDVVSAGSVSQALQLLAACPIKPDILICDYRLRNEENGIEAIEKLRSEYNEIIPAMLITGDTAPDRLQEAAASGLPLLHKPVSKSKLRAAISNLLASTKSQ